MPTRIDRHFLGLGPKGFHKLAYTQWGEDDNPSVLICVHGLARNRHDFDFIAPRLARQYRVIAVDMPGRGDSDWLADVAEYDMPRYLADLTALIARTGAETVHWLGTSMGGILGMVLAAQPKTPITRLVLNDIGGLIPQQGLARIRGYVGKERHFATMAEAEEYFRFAMAGFGLEGEAQWQHVIRHGLRPAEGVGWRLHYDPGIAKTFAAAPLMDIPLWPLWDAIRCPVLVVRGMLSDILTAETAQEMTRRGPGCTLVEVPGVGHAPMLFSDDQITPVADWLTGAAQAASALASTATPPAKLGWLARLLRRRPA